MITVKEEIIDLAVSKDDLLRLSAYHNSSCISIFIPTHSQGMETLMGQDALNLKNQLKLVRSKLAENAMTPRQIEKLILPVNELIDDTDFWRHQSEGLAVFLSEDIFEKYTLPIRTGEFNYVSSEFYLKQLFPLFNEYEQYFILTLRRDGVKLFKGNKFGLSEIDVSGLVPSRLEDSVGYDHEQKRLQIRTQPGGNKPGAFHGHGEGESKNKNELLPYFRDIDKGIMSVLHDYQEPPLVICCLDYMFPIFREVCTHKNLFSRYISGNPSELGSRSLLERARELLDPYFEREFLNRKERFMIGIAKGRASSNIREIIPAALEGKVDTLFLERRTDIFGIYDISNGGISIQEEQALSNVSLTNLAAKKVFEQGGKVYLLEKQDMPDGSGEISALFRYS